MKIIQGFVSIPSLADNAVNMIADFGELSPHAITFSRDLRTYANTTLYPHIEVITLITIDESRTEIPVPTAVSEQMLAVANWIYTQYSNSAIPINRNKDTLESAIVNEFQGVKRTVVNEILSTSEPSKRLPDNIRFDIPFENDQYRITLWFSDKRLRTQYKYYHIEVIPPIDDLSRIVGKLADVAVALNSVKIASVTNRINAYNVQYKVTNIHTLDVTWHDPNNSANRLNTGWTLLIHGNAGADTEVMKAAVRDYIETQYESNLWPKIYPALYSSNEFMIVPFWGDLASPSQIYDDGLYRSMVKLGTITGVKEKYIPHTYKYGTNTDTYFAEQGTVLGCYYRAMILYTIGNPANKEDKFSLMDIFPDYMSVSTKSPDFARMSNKTQKFVLKLNECLNHARLYDPNNGTPMGYTLSLRGAREYLGFDFEGFTYYVLTRLGYLREI